MELTLRAYQSRVDRWVRAYGVRYFDEMTNLGILTEEVGEVARVMVRTYGEQSSKSEEQDCKANLADELADVLFVVTCLANQTGIDLTAAVESNLEKKSRRDSRRHWENPKLNQSHDR
jgi:NTP pyrophosphatase (non-canonical NTP hydrolase)